jgi:bifunctional DNA-binding transcriptional regulator/antitoxin component of YhaV-PrlF toxin-antitoxin module
MRATSEGQVTIPRRIHEETGLLPNTEVEQVVDGSSVRIVKVESIKGESRGRRLIGHLRGKATASMSTDAILALTRNKP